MRKVRSKQGDTVDSLCWRYLGTTDAVEQVLALNPGIAEQGPILPAGIIVALPAEIGKESKERVTLW